MQEDSDVRYIGRMPWQRIALPSRFVSFILVAIVVGAALLSAGFVVVKVQRDRQALTIANETRASNGANLWVGDSKITTPSFAFPTSSQTISISPLFARYYMDHSGMSNLGMPMTVAFPIRHGWIQFFTSGALLLPTTQQGQSDNAADPLSELITNSASDPGTGIIRLPLLQALLTSGSEFPIDGSEAHFTYRTLRKATAPGLMIPSRGGNTDVFVKGGTRAGQDVGHNIPQRIWSYINRSTISPDGWRTDFGAPLTEALPFTTMVNGVTHHMLVQAFWRDGVILDQNALDATSQPQVTRIDTTLAYLRTIGPPPVTAQPQSVTWAEENTALLTAAGTGQAVAHIGQHFPVTLTGDTGWNAGMLWYRVQWSEPHRTGTGWAAATSLTFTSPGSVPGWAAMDALSPDLAAYLARVGGNVDAVVYDMTRQRYYTYNATDRFIMGSSMKVAIMVTFLDMIERQGRRPTGNEMNLLATMIENSNNDSASALYYGEIGGATGVASYLQRTGITGLSPDPDAWGYSLVSPLTMVNLLTRLYNGTILTTQDRSLAFYFMERIETDQQVGVGDTAPQGATVAMKDGWLPGPDNQWAMNSSGIVMLSKETYIISVYTQEQNALGDGQAIARHVCGTIASLLV